MTKKDKDSARIYYTIGEVAKMFNTSTSLIRFWEKEFDIIKPHKNKKGNRMFTQQDVDNFHLIYHLVKEKGYTLKGARQKLTEDPELTMKKFEIIKTLKKLRKFLEEIKGEI